MIVTYRIPNKFESDPIFTRMGALGWQAGLSLQDGLKCAYHDFMPHSAHQPV